MSLREAKTAVDFSTGLKIEESNRTDLSKNVLQYVFYFIVEVFT